MDTIFIPPTYETEVFLSDQNFLVILQTDGCGEKQEVNLSQEQAQTIFNHLRDSHFVS